MSVQDSTFRTTHVMDNEIIKANDFEFAFEQLVENVSKATQMLMESNQDFVINGKVIPATGMNVSVSPIYGVCKSTGKPFGRTETTDETIGFAGSESGRVDIIEVQGDWETYDNQQRAFNDPDTDTQTYQYVDTKKLMKPVYRVIQGVEGAGVAPEVEAGWVKLAEVSIRAGATSILATDIHNITADVAGLENEDWTNQEDITYNIGYISDVNARFRVQHEEDGTHSENSINAFSLDIGTGVNQINGNILPVGGAVSIPTQTIASTDSILSVIVKAAAMITSLYNGYLQYGVYGYKGEVKISSILDGNNELSKPISISAAGDGTAVIKIDNNAVLSVDANGKLSTNGYTASSNNHIVTKIVTDGLKTLIDALDVRVTNIENTSDVTVYSNGVLSSGTNGTPGTDSRYNVDPIVIYAATTANITLSGSQTIDGSSPADGSFILVKNQTNATENGIYQYSSSSIWARHNDYLSPNALKGKIFNVVNGTNNGGRMFYLPKVNFTDGSAFGTDDILYAEYFGSIAPKGNKVVMRDASGHVKTSLPSSADDAVNKGALLNLIYPVGSIYWTGKAPNDNGDPNVLFGGTWTQIKDKFILAAGDTYSNGATGGSATVTLTKNQIPSHTHTFRGSAVTSGSGGVDHTHGINHRHYTGGNTGYISSDHTHSGTTGGMSGNATGAIRAYYSDMQREGNITVQAGYFSGRAGGVDSFGSTSNNAAIKLDVSHTHDFSTGGVSANHYHSWGEWSSTPRYWGNEGVERLSSDGASAYAHTHSVTASGTNDNTGGGEAHNNMPPYIVKYCWERTA